LPELASPNMRKTIRFQLLLAMCLLGTSLSFAQAPVLFFSDLTWGPNTGNSDSTYSTNGGAYVTLYGNFLTPSPTITLNGASCLVIVSQPTGWRWYQKMTVQLTSSCGSGNFVVSVGGQNSNGLPFTVATGSIYYVATTGSDSATGSFSKPWLTLPHAVQTAGTAAGHIIYARNGVQQTTDDGQTWSAALTIRYEWSQGTQAQPDALIAYPGATVQIGPSTATTPANGIRSTDFTASPAASRGYWTFAGLTIRGGSSAIGMDGGELPNPAQYWRFVGNDISNAQSTGSGGGGAAFDVGLSSNVKIFGNYMHDLNLGTTGNLQQGMYFSTDANNIEFGWNEIYNSMGRAGMQIHSSPLCVPTCGTGDKTGLILHDYSIHDNKIHHTNEEGIIADTLDPSVGSGVRIYNNVIYDCARGGQGDCAHLQLSGDFNSDNGIGHSPAPFWWYNNTIAAVETSGSYIGVYGNWWPDIHSAGQTVTSRVSNNILYSSGDAPYLDLETYSGSNCTNTNNFTACPIDSGDKNLMYGAGVATFPNIFTNSINSDPLFANTAGFDFHLQSGSPAIGVGLTTIVDHTGGYSVQAPTYDIDGRVRPSPPSLGAYEYASGSSNVPNPPTGLTATVN
jgi:hypothetical protein